MARARRLGVIAVGVLLAASAPTVHAADPGADAPPTDVRAALEAARLPVDFTDTPVAEAVAAIAAAAKVPVKVSSALASSRVNLDRETVTLRGPEMPARTALDLVLPMTVTWTGKDGTLVLVTPEERFRDLPTREHSVWQLCARHADLQNRRGATGIRELVLLVQRAINPQADRSVAPWADRHGNDYLSCDGEVLKVTQTEAGHRQVQALLDQLELATRGRRTKPVVGDRQAALGGPAAKALATRVSVGLENVPLEVAVRRLKKACPGLEVVYDPALGRSGIPLDRRRVTVAVRNEPARTALARMLGRDVLGYTVEPDFVLITTLQKTWSDLRVVMYPVGAFVGRARSPSAAVGRMVTVLYEHASLDADPAIAPWDRDGGPASITAFGPALVVVQNEMGQALVARLVAQLPRLLKGADPASADGMPAPRGGIASVRP